MKENPVQPVRKGSYKANEAVSKKLAMEEPSQTKAPGKNNNIEDIINQNLNPKNQTQTKASMYGNGVPFFKPEPNANFKPESKILIYQI